MARDYKSEAKYEAKPEQVAHRVARNRARRRLQRASRRHRSRARDLPGRRQRRRRDPRHRDHADARRAGVQRHRLGCLRHPLGRQAAARPERLRALAGGKPLQSKKTFTGRIPAYPTGCAICEVEIDPDTGAVSIPRYGSIDDAGQAINPLILHGQVHGGIVQGIGQALLETMAYSDEGQVLSGSFMDYGIPRATHVPSFDIALAEDPTKGNPLRVKGGGEAGITPALAVVMNAIMDALAPLGVTHMDMPATPHRIWAAIRKAQAN